MKTTFAIALLGLFPAALAQTLAPSPTESVGCEPHGDHWHCEAARTDAGAAASTAAEEDHDDHEAGATESLAPSPTESVGCEPHGDHWHCEGPRTTLATAEAPATTEADDHDDHDHSDEATDAAGPSPTESVGCEPHGDHWHCEGPRTDADAAATTGVDAAATTAADDHDDEDHSAGATESLAPSPTESVGCEPHGDHWHCEGPRTTADGTGAPASGTPTTSASVEVTNAAGIEMVPVVGLFAAAVLAL